jgi:hypothetical protein
MVGLAPAWESRFAISYLLEICGKDRQPSYIIFAKPYSPQVVQSCTGRASLGRERETDRPCRATPPGSRTGTHHVRLRPRWRNTPYSGGHQSFAQPPCPGKPQISNWKGHGKYTKFDLLVGNWVLARLEQLRSRLGVAAQILLASDKDNGQTFAKVVHLADPLPAETESSQPPVTRENDRRTFSWMLSSESGESMAKQMRITCASG